VPLVPGCTWLFDVVYDSSWWLWCGLRLQVESRGVGLVDPSRYARDLAADEEKAWRRCWQEGSGTRCQYNDKNLRMRKDWFKIVKYVPVSLVKRDSQGWSRDMHLHFWQVIWLCWVWFWNCLSNFELPTSGLSSIVSRASKMRCERGKCQHQRKTYIQVCSCCDLDLPIVSLGLPPENYHRIAKYGLECLGRGFCFGHDNPLVQFVSFSRVYLMGSFGQF